MLKNITDRYIF